jgi:CRISPR/Cas system-associated exonuclease Cas4 (RecB family)
MNFLKRIAIKFLTEYGSDIHKLAFVFPTRRAGIYFLRHLQNHKQENSSLWATPIFSIEDFITGLSGSTAADQLELIFTLYDIYRTNVRGYPKEFEDFYSWGKMILADFNEVDKHLVNTDELFRILREYKSVEDINEEDKAEIYKKYTGFWDDLGILYREFNRALIEKNRVYEGLAFRQVAQDIAGLLKTGVPAWKKAIFCGFNALTPAEETIIRYLISEKKGEIYWDMDRYFVEDVNQEAGYFFRQNKETLIKGEPLWVDDELARPKTIDIIGVQSKVSQAKEAGLRIEQLLKSRTGSEDIAVVLPDEAMLFPVLNSLPAGVDRVNITIGFPLDRTPVYSLLNSLIEMQLRYYESRSAVASKQDDKKGFYYKDVLRVLNHPYIKPFAPEEIESFVTRTKEENLVYVTEKDMEGFPSFPKKLFSVKKDSREIIEYFLELSIALHNFYRDNEPEIFSIDYEYLYHFYTLLTRLQDALKNAGLVLDTGAFRRLFDDIIKNSRIPFTGHPLEGLQIMGVLETQTLSFANLFLFSLNEGHLPPGKNQQSFIPYEVRCSAGLPTYKERDAIAAYHFYRLLKNSEHITLLYTTEAKGMEKSEKSRFLDQLLIEFAGKNPDVALNHYVVDFVFSAQDIKEITVEKSPEIIETLSQKVYSASSLLDYLTCPLKFYFSRILRLKEEEDVSENPDQRMVGDIIHETLYRLYDGYTDRDSELTSKDIETVKNKIEATLESSFRKILKTGDLKTGRNRIAFEVMLQFLDHFFDKEKQSPGFKILMLEKKIDDVYLPFTVNGKRYSGHLVGHIDRVDITKDQICRIIDYKTGKVNPLNLKSMAELAGPGAVDRREAFQLFFYRYLLKKSWAAGDRYRFRLGVYPFKKVYDELSFIGVGKSDIIDDGMVQEYEEILIDLFGKLFDGGTPFSQVKDEKNCRFCPYIDICCKPQQDTF